MGKAAKLKRERRRIRRTVERVIGKARPADGRQ